MTESKVILVQCAKSEQTYLKVTTSYSSWCHAGVSAGRLTTSQVTTSAGGYVT